MQAIPRTLMTPSCDMEPVINDKNDMGTDPECEREKRQIWNRQMVKTLLRLHHNRAAPQLAYPPMLLSSTTRRPSRPPFWGKRNPYPSPRPPKLVPRPCNHALPISPELPPVDTSAKPNSFADATPRASEDASGRAPTVPISPVKAVDHAAAAASNSPDTHHKKIKKVSVAKSHGQRPSRQLNRPGEVGGAYSRP
jgi:hypothetical protein